MSRFGAFFPLESWESLESQLVELSCKLNVVQTAWGYISAHCRNRAEMEFEHHKGYKEPWLIKEQSNELLETLDALIDKRQLRLDSISSNIDLNYNEFTLHEDIVNITGSWKKAISFMNSLGLQEVYEIFRPCLYESNVDCLTCEQNFPSSHYVGLNDENLMICREVTNIVRSCFVDAYIDELIVEFDKSLCAKPSFESCREEWTSGDEKQMLPSEVKPLEIPRFIMEEEDEVPPIEEQQWYKVEFIEVVPQLHEFKHFIGPILQVPYRRKKSSYERAFFWYREGYSDS